MIEHQSSQQIMVVPYFERNLTLLWGWREMSLEIREPSKEQTFCYLRICSFGKNKYLIEPPTYSETVDVYIIYIYIVYIWYSSFVTYFACVFSSSCGVSRQFFTPPKKKRWKNGDRGPDVEPASPKEDIGYSSPSFESLEEIVENLNPILSLTALTYISYTPKKKTWSP